MNARLAALLLLPVLGVAAPASLPSFSEKLPLPALSLGDAIKSRELTSAFRPKITTDVTAPVGGSRGPRVVRSETGLPIVRPRTDVDHAMRIVEPDSSVDYKILTVPARETGR